MDCGRAARVILKILLREKPGRTSLYLSSGEEFGCDAVCEDFMRVGKENIVFRRETQIKALVIHETANEKTGCSIC